MAEKTDTQTQSSQLLLGPDTGTLSITSLQTDYGAYIDLFVFSIGHML